jgi:tRNA(adenine34) deaminase
MVAGSSPAMTAEGRGCAPELCMTPMEIALGEARAAAARGEVPVGAVVLDASGAVLARAGNEVEARHDPTAHAELLALRAAAEARGETRLPDCELVVTLEPCPMCAQAASFYRIRRLTFGAYDAKGGGVEHGARVFDASSCHHRPEVVGGVRESDAAALLQAFFALRR